MIHYIYKLSASTHLRQTVPLGKMLGWKKPEGNWPAGIKAVRKRTTRMGKGSWSRTFRRSQRIILKGRV